MPDETMREVRTDKEGLMLDEVVQRLYGKTDGPIEAVLDANPGLAALGVILPLGTVIRVPDFVEPKPEEPVRLW